MRSNDRYGKEATAYFFFFAFFAAWETGLCFGAGFCAFADLDGLGCGLPVFPALSATVAPLPFSGFAASGFEAPSLLWVGRVATTADFPFLPTSGVAGGTGI